MKIFRFCLLLCLLSLAASASVITYGPIDMGTPSPSGFAFGNFGQTSFTSTVALPQFDPSMGTLNFATFSITGTVSGNVQFENEDNIPITAHVDVLATVELDDTTGNGWSATATPENQSDHPVSAYDGIEDYAGTSGFTINDIRNTQTASYTTIDGLDDLSGYIGTGTVVFSIQATGFSSGSGGANLVRHLTTFAASNASVTYDYTTTTAVPEPATWGYMALSIIGLAYRRRRRRA